MRTFKLPDLGEGLQEAELVNWLIKEGDTVKVDQPIASVETAKAVVDVPAPWAGKITKLHGKAGDIIPTGAALVEFDLEGESATAPAAKRSDAQPATAPAQSAKPAPVAEDSGTVVGSMPTSTSVVEETAIIRKQRKTAPAPVKALPSVRILARQLGVDLATCQASGRNGNVTADDVRAIAPGTTSAASDVPAPASYAATVPWTLPAVRTDIQYGAAEPLHGPRRAMHASMAKSRSEVAACTLFDDADIHKWMPGQDITARIIRAIVAGCRVEPELNAWYDGAKLERTLHRRVDLGMAVDTPDGLIVPVLRSVDTKSAAALRADLNRMKQATRNRSVAPADMKNATFTLSNFGMLAGRYATPVVVPPQVAILGTGGLRYDVVPVMGGIEVHQRIPLSVTFDHRCVTGGTACRWLAAVISDLQKTQ
ncbi:MAG: dihydrolipoamide acetyltransferase family protein [Gammaproteobacteria bacterium]